jgi:hypothetical protein
MHIDIGFGSREIFGKGYRVDTKFREKFHIAKFHNTLVQGDTANMNTYRYFMV